MIFTASITTDANTSEADPQLTSLKVTKGLIWLLEVEFPAGCCGLCHLQIFDGNYQLFPSTPGDSIHSEGAVLSYDDLYLKNAAPFFLKIKTWNLDETWPHTLQVRIGIASTEAAMSRYMPSLSWDKFTESMKAFAAQQEALKQAQIDELAKSLEL